MTVTPHFGNDGRSGAYRASGVPDGAQVAWIARTGAPVVASPVLVGGTLVAADVSGAVHAFDARTGEVRWRRALGENGRDGLAEILTAPAVWNSWIFVQYEIGECAIFDLRTGELVRKLDHDGCPTVIGDLLLLHTLEEVCAFRLPDLKPRWRTREAPGWVQTSPAISEAGIAYAALGNEPHHTHTGVHVFDVNRGELLTFVEGGDITFPGDSLDEDEEDEESSHDDEQVVYFAQAHAVLAEERVWMPVYREEEDWTAQIVGLDPQTGEQIWGYLPDPGRDNEVDSAVAVSDGTVYVVEILRDTPPEQDSARLHAVDIATGRPRWIRSFGSCAGSPVVAGRAVYVATLTGTVSAFDTVTGEQRWTAKIGEEILHPCYVDDFGDQYHEHGLAVLPGDGVLYVRTSAGVVAMR
ncbi:hypothetical protein DMB42_50210 [Nonomuraea sp. WAC 01424]|uniref:outer membrane protein assembly factor BamB family protein n=1 Tax=Nonomuraea sp. WAC 01424 TaxID=2203200 RepID=UPI000F79B4D5|nr:PQQ-binding-like beta-propeller repeat protein [Nonomuraea sp. WAC 01424]RSM95300.1 hypothetical protein DMB42_50210 [Nonomuraea sp. WAC 01424]